MSERPDDAPAGAGGKPPAPPAQGKQQAPANEQDPPDPDIGSGFVGRWTILLTTGICAIIAGSGHVVLWWGEATDHIDKGVYWPPVFGIALSLVAIIAFGGFYIASRRARVAIGATFVVSFFVLLSYAATITQLGQSGDDDDSRLATELFGDFRTIMTTIIAFYFGAETVVTVAKVIGTSRSGDVSSRQIIGGVDRDLPAGQR